MPLLVQVSLHYRPIRGGQEVYIANLSKVLADAGWETKVIQPYRGEKGSDVAIVPRIMGVARYFPWFDELQFTFWAAIAQVRLLNRADAILCHYASTALFIGLVSKWKKKTIILSHGVEWNIDRMNWHDRIREWNAKRLFRSLKIVVNDTDYLRRMGLNIEPGQKMFEEAAPNVWFIPNCIDTTHFSPMKVPAVRNLAQPIILVPRQICEDRGIHLAIEAFAVFVGRRSGSILLIVGPKRNLKYFTFCESLIEKHGLGGHVFFKPPVTNNEMVDLYRSADVTLIPTLRREGTSLSALESMACGTPTVVTDVAGLRDLPAVHCLPNAMAIADGIGHVLDHRPIESDRQRDAVEGNFCFEKWARAWVFILNTHVSRMLP